jgi:predicted O-methyltransferase YrrM
MSRYTVEIVRRCIGRWREIPVYGDGRFPPSPYYRVLRDLVATARPSIAVELGTDGGGAALNMALGCPQTMVFTIDHTRTPTVEIVEKKFDNVTFYLADSVERVSWFLDGTVGLLFVDTTHTYEQTTAEHNAWLPKMMPGGLIVFDDVGRPGMDRAMEEIGGLQIPAPELGGDGGMVFRLVEG